MHVRIYQSITEVPAEAWDAILGDSATICTHAYLQAVEKSAINDCVFYYLVAYDAAGRIAAHTSAFSITMDMLLFANRTLLGIVQLIRKAVPSFLTIRMLECGTPVALGRQIAIREDVDTAQVIDQFVEALEGLARKNKTGYLLFRDYRLHERAEFDRLQAHGYAVVQNFPEAVLRIRWATFQDYVSDMRSGYRRKVKINTDKLNDKGITTELLSEFRHLAGDLVTQWKHIYDNAREYKREVLTREFYENINDALPDAKVLVFRKEGRMIAHCLLLFEGDVLRWMYVGKDAEEATDLYPFMLYEIVRVAIESDVKAVKLGITTYVAKTDVGAELVPLYMYMKHDTRVFPKIAPWLFSKMTHLPNLKPKSVFKSQPQGSVQDGEPISQAGC